jgi:hypothetical protein
MEASMPFKRKEGCKEGSEAKFVYEKKETVWEMSLWCSLGNLGSGVVKVGVGCCLNAAGGKSLMGFMNGLVGSCATRDGLQDTSNSEKGHYYHFVLEKHNPYV